MTPPKPPAIVYPPHPAHLDVYVDTLGPALTVRFIRSFGGSRITFPRDPKGRSAAEQLIGADLLRILGERLPKAQVNVPVARTWMIHALFAEGRNRNEIARTLGCSHETVRKALLLDPKGGSHPVEMPGRGADARQLKLF